MNKHLTYEEWFNEYGSYEEAYKGYFNQQKEIDRLNNIIDELEKTIENRLMAVPDDVLDDEIEEIKRTTKIAVYQVILGDLYKLKELKEGNNNEY